MRKLLIILLVFTSIVSFGQDQNGFEFKIGYGSYSMKDLSDDLHYNQQNLRNDVAIKVVNDFPPYLNFGFNWFIDFGKFEYGAGYTFLSTGGRIHYKDYSGEVGLEHLFQGHSLSGIARYNFVNGEKFKLDFTTQLSYNLSLLKTSAWLRIGTREDRVSGDFSSQTAGLTLLVGGKYYFTQRFYGGARVGGFADTQGVLKLKDNKKVKLGDHKGDEMRSDWTGFRAEVFLGCKLDW